MRSIFAVFITTLLLMSCSKDENIFIPDQSYIINKESLLSNFVTIPKSYKLILEDGPTTFIGPNSTYFQIPNSALENSEGTVITGEIKLNFNEFTASKSDLLFGPSTMNGPDPIKIYKSIYIHFTQNGHDLKITKPIKVSISQKQNEGIIEPKLYLSKANDDHSAIQNYNEIQKKVNIESGTLFDGEEMINFEGFTFEVLENLSWYSIGTTISKAITPNVNLCIQNDPTYHAKNSLVYFVSQKYNMVINLASTNNAGRFCITTSKYLDLIEGKIVMISDFGNGKFNFGITNAILGEDADVTITSAPKDIKEIRAALKAL